jgi:hypothetical protein
MGLTTRRCDVYGGEYAPKGLRLFAWWKKNGERRLQKAGSGFAQIRSHLKPTAPLSFYTRPKLAPGARSYLTRHESNEPSLRSIQIDLACVTWRASGSGRESLSPNPATRGRPTWPRETAGLHQRTSQASEPPGRSITSSATTTPWPLCWFGVPLFFFFPFFFIYFC